MQDDSSSYVRASSDAASLLTGRSASLGHSHLIEPEFEFDSVILDSQVYRTTFRAMLQRQGLPTQHRSQNLRDPLALDVDYISMIQDETNLRPTKGIKDKSTTDNSDRQGDHTNITSWYNATGQEIAEDSDRSSIITTRASAPALGGLAVDTGSRSRDTPDPSERTPTRLAASETSQGPSSLDATRPQQMSTPSKTSMDSRGYGKQAISKTDAQLRNMLVPSSRRRVLNILSRLTPTLRGSREPKEDSMDQEQKEKLVKLLLLGTSESGKSTLVKNMRLAWLGPFPDEEAYSYRDIVWSNMLFYYVVLFDELADQGIEVPDWVPECHVKAIRAQQNVDAPYEKFSAEAAEAIIHFRDKSTLRYFEEASFDSFEFHQQVDPTSYSL